MDRHKTQKKAINESDIKTEQFKAILEDSAKEAYARPWHRIERGLRLNRLRIFVEDISSQFNMTHDEKDAFFIYLQKLLDKKMLNTLKVVHYDQETQRIKSIRGLELKRNTDNILKWAISVKKKADGTRKKKQEEISIDKKIEEEKDIKT